MKEIILEKVSVHNLKEVDLRLPAGKLILFTGVSGSGKSSMAFDTLYMEGQVRYIESLSSFQRQNAGDIKRPELKRADGITPTISIEQKSQSRNPRSTVGTMTEIADFMRVLYSRVGVAFCPVSKEAISPQSQDRIAATLQATPLGKKLTLLFPIARQKKGEFLEEFAHYQRRGFTRGRIDGKMVRLDEEIALDKNISHDIDIIYDRLQVSEESYGRIGDSARGALDFGKGTILVIDDEENESLFSTHGFSPKSGLSYQALEPADFSFNTPSGMCERCQGLGRVQEFDLSKIIVKDKSIKEGACSVASPYNTVRYGNIYDNLARIFNFSLDTPWKKLSESAKKVFLYGTEKKWTKMLFVHPETGKSWVDHIQWRGALYEAKERIHQAKSDRYKEKMGSLLHEEICPECQGGRLKAYPALVQFHGKTLPELFQLPLIETLRFFSKIKLTNQEKLIAGELIQEIQNRLGFLIEVGLDYLSLNREAPSLSGGESQRVRLASQIGSSLVGVTYILDEPSIGLHPRDNTRLISTLKNLRDKGNTVVVVEHDEETLWQADHIVDFGPLAGSRGGQIIFSGAVEDLLLKENSLTGAYLAQRLKVKREKKKKKAEKFLQLKGASFNNLKNVDVKIPLGMFVVVTGVSGSGKSSLILETLAPAIEQLLSKSDREPSPFYKKLEGMQAIDKQIVIDQSPIGKTARSNPATYIKVFDEIRALFAKLTDSASKGFSKGRFSFNVKEGSCETCLGRGVITLDMDFLEEKEVICPECEGKRFDSATLAITYRGKNIYDILEMSCEEASDFFSEIPSIHHKVKLLVKVGLGYLKLGQPSTTLSGGEAQRIKLAKELVRPHTQKTLYIFDEPTTGLHFHDIQKLLDIFDELLEKGASLIIIEHNPDLITAADWIIDLGPEGGAGGGQLLFSGPFEKLLKEDSATAVALRHHLKGDFRKPIAQNKAAFKETSAITIEGAYQNNLKHVSATIPRHQITLCTGPSGSGKSSFAFDTLFAEGQRRFVETLSSYARQFVKEMPKPKVARIEGLSPAIAVEQKVHAGNPRSTVGTMTEIYDYLRLLYAHLGVAYDPDTKEIKEKMTQERLYQELMSHYAGQKVEIYAHISLKKQEKIEDLTHRIQQAGFLRVRLNGSLYELDEILPYDRKRKNELLLLIDRIKIAPHEASRLHEAIHLACNWGKGELVLFINEEKRPYLLHKTSDGDHLLSPALFAFNKKEGMCPGCLGIGVQYGADLASFPEITERSLAAFIRILSPSDPEIWSFLWIEAKKRGVDPFTPMQDQPKNGQDWIFQGSTKPLTSRNSLLWIGLNALIAKCAVQGPSEWKMALLPFLQERRCAVCEGSRLNREARHVYIEGLSISALCAQSIEEMRLFIEGLKIGEDKSHVKEIRSAIGTRLTFLEDVGLGYLSLDRKAPTLSGGEAERLKLARQLGSGLTEVLYVLDEPTIGLHPQDIDRLNRTLLKLKEGGNTLVLVEHDPATLKIADHILDFGPLAGEKGGYIVATGTLDALKKNPDSITGQWLSQRKKSSPQKERPLDFGLHLKNLCCHNIQNLSLAIPTNGLVVLSGLSGSGKSTLLLDLLKPLADAAIRERKGAITNPLGTLSGMETFQKVSPIDQDPLGTTIRSDIATYTDLLTPLRTFFAALPQAKAMGLEPKHFSYNHLKGMCRRCFGIGFRRIDLHFLPPVSVQCEECHGLRLNKKSLDVIYNGKNLGQWLQMTVDEALEPLSHFKKVKRILEALIASGLGYLKLCQEIVTLSGGEAQRLKLSSELAKRGGEKTLFLIDEPTRGLHPEDTEKLLPIFHKLIEKGHAVLVIEHDLHFIKSADWVIEMGPGPGVLGGKIIAEGSPKSLKNNPHSVTGPYL